VTKRTFKQAFNAVFHDELAYEDFCNLDMEREIQSFAIANRTVFKMSDKFKQYLRFIDRVIFRSLAKDEDVAHSFIKGKSTLTAVKRHVLNKFFFLTDVEDFYSNITAVDVRRILNRDADLVPISDFKDFVDLIVEMTTVGGSIPVGFSTSPQLSNSFLFEFDGELNKFCQDNGLVYTRYVDDIIISGPSIEDVLTLRDKVPCFLNKYASSNLRLNSRKTRITHTGNKVKILGLVILPNGKITFDYKYKKNIESLVHFYVTDRKKYESFLEDAVKGGERSLFGMLHYARSIDPEYINKLQRKYGVYALRSLMEDKWSDN
jgi:RNA-directed DNA polymerase